MLRPGECSACGAGRFRYDTDNGHLPFCWLANDAPYPWPTSDGRAWRDDPPIDDQQDLSDLNAAS